MAAITKKFIDLLLKPFREHFLFLISFFILATSPFVIRQICFHFYINAFLQAVHCIVLSYFVTLLISIIQPKIIRRILTGLILSVSLVDFAINFYCVIQFGYFFDADVAMLIVDTNLNEAREFSSVLLPPWIIIVVVSIYTILLTIWILSKKHNLNLKKKTSLFAMAGLIICTLACGYSWPAWVDGPIHRLIGLSDYEAISDLRSHYTHPKIILQREAHSTSNIVLIIGESFARSHSSLYGYNKETNPYLEDYLNSSFLFAFDSINSPAPTTSESIRLMLSTYNKSQDNDAHKKKWYDYTSIVEVLQICDYNCHWFSNQSKGSRYNGIARIFANACQHQWFLQKEASLNDDANMDMILVDSSYHCINHLNSKEKYFIVFHMMGSHCDYSKRYPKEFSKFSENDYLDKPQNHRKTLATYDNSILYNDYVVSQIINLFKDKETIIIYLPDHGQVMYRDPKMPDYFVHGKPNDPVSCALGEEIPMIIFTSSLFQERHPDTMEHIKYRQDNPKSWNSDDLPYFIMDLIGVKEINGENIQSKSILY